MNPVATAVINLGRYCQQYNSDKMALQVIDNSLVGFKVNLTETTQA